MRILDSNDSGYGLHDIHEEYLLMMDDLHKYCIDHGIKYSLSGGTLLGAIRHGGFIPWDDDADVMMDRENYKKFLSTFTSVPMYGYEIVSNSWVKRLTREDNPFKEQERQCIDLFVFDPVPFSKIQAGLKIFIIKFLQGMLKEQPKYEKFSASYKFVLFITWLLGWLFPKKAKLQWYDDVSQWGKKYWKINIYNTWFEQIGRTEFDKNIVDNYIFVKFENHEYMSIKMYDSYLTELYGDYMQIPPKDKRVPSHI